ncbi:coil containing protein [Vibrio phage 1.161.O._10N.261.48.C5]|nr:coil containing protein [Vibrio phage 1.161.O._10N.261.48.C5]
MIKSLGLTTDDGIRITKSGDLTTVTGLIGGYRKVGVEEEFFYYTDLLEISEEQKVEFECRVREILREVGGVRG